MDNYRYRPASALVATITVLMVLEILLSLAGALSTWFEIQLLEEVRAGLPVAEQRANASDLRQFLIAAAHLVVYLTIAVLFLIWVNRANKNARALGAHGMEYTPGWCVGWYFIPFANLVKPYQCMREIWKASHPDYRDNWRAAPGSVQLPLWWGLWLISNIVGQIAFRASLAATTLESTIAASWAAVCSDLLNVPSTLLALGGGSIHPRDAGAEIAEVGRRMGGGPWARSVGRS